MSTLLYASETGYSGPIRKGGSMSTHVLSPLYTQYLLEGQGLQQGSP